MRWYGQRINPLPLIRRHAWFLGIWVLYLGISLTITFLELERAGLLFLDSDGLVRALGLSDAGQYLKLGIAISHLDFKSNSFQVLGLWPPGMPLYLAALSLIPGAMVYKIAIVTNLIFTLPSAIAAAHLRRQWGILAVVGVAIVWLLNPYIAGWSLGSGIFYSESVGIALVSLAFLALLKSKNGVFPKRNLVTAGALVGAAFYFRAAYIPILIPAITAVVLAAYFALATFKSQQKVKTRLSNVLRPTTAFALTLLLVCAPWLLVVATVVRPGSLSWVNNDYLWAQSWTSDSHLINLGGGFLVEGGANWPCQMNPTLCSEYSARALAMDPYDFSFFRGAALQELVRNPLGFLNLRFPNAIEGFMTEPGDALSGNSSPWFVLVEFALAAALLLKLFMRKAAIHSSLAALFLVGVITGTFGIVMYTHTESRYLISAHWALILMGLLVFWNRRGGGSMKYRLGFPNLDIADRA